MYNECSLGQYFDNLHVIICTPTCFLHGYNLSEAILPWSKSYMNYSYFPDLSKKFQKYEYPAILETLVKQQWHQPKGIDHPFDTSVNMPTPASLMLSAFKVPWHKESTYSTNYLVQSIFL